MAGEVAPDPGTGPASVHRAKIVALGPGRTGATPSNVAWIASLPPAEQARFAGRIRRKPTRTLSGVAIVAVMTSPARCPHGRCTYCPGGLDRGSPQSYTGEEPSALRGAQFGYDARIITAQRLAALEAIGHPTSKVEAIVMGGTFTSRPPSYQATMLKGVYDGLNGTVAASLADAQRTNETAARRLVSLTVETRPDGLAPPQLAALLDAGVTRVEIGVECLRDPVLFAIGRGHGVDAVVTATRAVRDHGLKIGYHMMPGLPGMTPADDLADLRRLFADPAFRPDMLKLYPTLVIPGTPLYDDWQAGRFTPYDEATVVDLLARAKAELPPWVRIQRIQRDIPARLIAAGVRRGNLRELVHDRLAADGRRCRCLRCREVGRRAIPSPTAFELTERSYAAGNGREVFLAFEEPRTDTVAGFLRLRFPSSTTSGGVTDPVIRELKVLGSEIAVGATRGDGPAYQHRGFGRALVDRAIERARDAGARKLLVTSAVGTRGYYARLGFRAQGPHMAKPLFA